MTNVEFVNAKVEDFVEDFVKEQKVQKTTIMLDPPRDGLYPSAIPHILALGAEEIIYVSCNPATLVRDIDKMMYEEVTVDETEGVKTLRKPRDLYRITDITPVDMFPHTHHIETVVRLEKI